MRLSILTIVAFGIQAAVGHAEEKGFSILSSLPFLKTAEDAKDVKAATAKSETPEQQQTRARIDWHRRVAVINKLREIGLRRGDQELLRQADMLDQRAFEVYMQHTGRIVPAETEKQP